MQHICSKLTAVLCGTAIAVAGMTGAVTAQEMTTTLGSVLFQDNGSYTVESALPAGQVDTEGWYTPDDGMNFMYYYADGTYATGTVTLPDGITYSFAPNGYERMYWQQVDGKRFYYHPLNGRLVQGWVSYQGNSYYVTLETGKAVGVQNVNGVPCYFNDYGQLQSGFCTYPDGSVHNVQADGTPVTGFFTDAQDNTYYFDQTGTAVTGTLSLSGKRYTFDAAGVLISEELESLRYEVPYYNQADPRWGNVYIQYKTIAQVGCLTCAVAMMHSYYTGTEITPDQMKNQLEYVNDNMMWSKLFDLGYHVKENISGNSNAYNLKQLYTLLQTGPVIVGATSSRLGMHYVLVNGCTNPNPDTLKASDFTILDPGYRNKSTLDQHFADYGSWYQFYYK